MKIEKVNALVGSRQKPEDEHFALQVYRTGVDAVPVPEIAILQAMHGLDSVTDVSLAGEYETTKQNEFDRLVRAYPKSYHLAYPSAAANMPKLMADLDLEPGQIDKSPPKAPVEEVQGPIARGMTHAIEAEHLPTDKAELRRRLAERGVQLPFGNHGVPRLQGLLLEEMKKQKAEAV